MAISRAAAAAWRDVPVQLPVPVSAPVRRFLEEPELVRWAVHRWYCSGGSSEYPRHGRGLRGRSRRAMGQFGVGVREARRLVKY